MISSVCVAPAFEISAQLSRNPRQVGMSGSGSGRSTFAVRSASQTGLIAPVHTWAERTGNP